MLEEFQTWFGRTNSVSIRNSWTKISRHRTEQDKNRHEHDRPKLNLFLGRSETFWIESHFIFFSPEKVIIILWQKSQIWTTTKGESIVAECKANLSTDTHWKLFTRVWEELTFPMWTRDLTVLRGFSGDMHFKTPRCPSLVYFLDARVFARRVLSRVQVNATGAPFWHP